MDTWEYDGCEYDNLTDLIQCGRLEFCGCGMPERNLQYILGGLELINEKEPEGMEWREWWGDKKKRNLEHFGNDQAEYFFYYWCDEKEYTEHGGSVPGWLTDEGISLLALLREWNKRSDDE